MESYVPSILTTTILFLILGIIVVALRFYTRLIGGNLIGHDDILILAALLLYITMASFLFVGTQYGMGQHEKGLDMNDIIESSKYIWLTVLFYLNLVTVVKASMTTCLLRLTVASPCSYMLWAALAVNVVMCFIASFYMIFNCRPIEYAWTQSDSAADGGCKYDSADALGYAWAGFSIALYVLLVITPVILVWDMQMHIKKKALVVAVLGLGVFAAIASCVRISVFARDLDYSDPLYTISPMLIWSVVEAGLGIVASCIATLRPLLRHLKIQGFAETEPSPEEGGQQEHKFSTVSKIFDKFAGTGAHTVTIVHKSSQATIEPSGIRAKKTFHIKTIRKRSEDIQHEIEMQGRAGKVPEADDVNTGGW